MLQGEQVYLKTAPQCLKNPMIENHALSEMGQELHREQRAGQGDGVRFWHGCNQIVTFKSVTNPWVDQPNVKEHNAVQQKGVLFKLSWYQTLASVSYFLVKYNMLNPIS